MAKWRAVVSDTNLDKYTVTVVYNVNKRKADDS